MLTTVFVRSKAVRPDCDAFLMTANDTGLLKKFTTNHARFSDAKIEFYDATTELNRILLFGDVRISFV